MMNTRLIALTLVLALAGLVPAAAHAQSTSCTSSNVTENFTGLTTNCQWYFIGGACLTAGNVSSTTSPGYVPSCAALSGAGQYYNGVTLNGGNSGNITARPDTPATGGALRLTNNSNNEAGAIISQGTYALASNGLQVTFTTETYAGDSGSNSYGGANPGDGADGISFFLQDVSVDNTPTLGDFGGSLGYTCSNANNSAAQGYDGMIGAYIGLGIDDYGNFLDGSWVTTVSGTGTTTTVFNPSVQGANPQDNTASGYGKLANRVGLRGAGNVAWSWLNANYPNYYPSSLTGTAQAAQAVEQTCATGYLWNFSGVHSTTPAGNSTYTPANPGSGSQSLANPYNATITTTAVNDYAAIPNGYKVLSKQIANESAIYRGYATTGTAGNNYGIPITYNLTISPAGLLSLSYSYDGGNFQPVITGQSIVNNGALPANVRFGFAGSTGGSTNIHEIMCFQASPQNSASSSAGLNQKQTAKVQTGTQVYFAFYNSSNWTGSLTSQYLVSPVGDPNTLEIDSTVNWDASCVLTGTAGGPTCPTTGVANVAAETPDASSSTCGSTSSTGPCTRQIWSWNGTTGVGVPFTWSSSGATSLSTTEQTNLNVGTIPAPPSGTETANSILEYLRGIRADEQTIYGYGAYTPTVNPSGFRARTSVLGDIVDSSPTWVGPPSATFPTSWTDSLYPTETLPENSGPTYATFETTYSGRMNVVYAGANDGFMHGFRSGYFSNGTYAGTTTGGVFTGTDNDGEEVLAFMPGYVVNTINSSIVAGSSPTAPNSVLDYASPLYAHKFNVDGTPGTGDLFYGGQWHTWLVGGLGAGGSAIYALDITNPTNFAEANASTGVVGEWSSAITTTSTTSGSVVTTKVTGATSTFTCATVTATYAPAAASTCGNSLGKTFGTPQIRRFHNNPALGGPTTSWGAVFGNGSGSFNGDAGIYVMLANNSGSPTIYYLSTGVGSNYIVNSGTGAITQSGNSNGIYYVAPADLDGDHVIDYVYAGDLQGNVWRFDLTSSNPANWAVTAANGIAATTLPGKPIYTTGSTSIPITTEVLVAAVAGAGSVNPRILIEFGTGEQTAFTNNTAATYATAQQYLVGVWDWNLSGDSTSSTPVAGAWNTISNTKYASLPTSATSAPGALSGFTSLEQQTISSTTYNAAFGTSVTNCTGSACATNDYYRTISANTICWAGGSGTCSTGQSATQYGWYVGLTSGYPDAVDPSGLLPSTTTNAALIYEQVIFNPTLQDGTFLVNTTIPPTTSLAQCASTAAGGWTLAVNPATGGAFTNSFFGASNHTFLNVNNLPISGIALSGTGTPAVVVGGTSTYLVSQTTSGTGAIVQINPPGGSQGSRLTWIQRR
jgi:type IV pilus assembly protein PilY1